jgi:uncharacterized paraquat-inducible protein A
VERRFLSGGAGDLYRQYYGADAEDDRYCLAVLERQRQRARDSERMHLIYEVVEFVGRWSMIDVFVIAVLSALVRMGGLMNIYPAIGAVMFALVVVMTMFSAMTFDPRLLWDREPDSSHEEIQQHGK